MRGECPHHPPKEKKLEVYKTNREDQHGQKENSEQLMAKKRQHTPKKLKEERLKITKRSSVFKIG